MQAQVVTQLKASYHEAAQDKSVGQQIEVSCRWLHGTGAASNADTCCQPVLPCKLGEY